MHLHGLLSSTTRVMRESDMYICFVCSVLLAPHLSTGFLVRFSAQFACGSVSSYLIPNNKDDQHSFSGLTVRWVGFAASLIHRGLEGLSESLRNSSFLPHRGLFFVGSG